jgi:UMF1 family MFS transporter
MYDWANSAYMTTVAAAFLPIYFQEVVSPGGPTSLTMWAWTYSASSLIAFLIAPVLGAIADYSACKKKFLLTFAGTGSMCTLLLALSGP